MWEATEALVSTARQASAAAEATRLSPAVESEEMEVRLWLHYEKLLWNSNRELIVRDVKASAS